MSVIVYIGKSIPDKNLQETLKYKVYLTPEQKEEIMRELQVYHKDLENYHVDIQVEAELKLYKK